MSSFHFSSLIDEENPPAVREMTTGDHPKLSPIDISLVDVIRSSMAGTISEFNALEHESPFRRERPLCVCRITENRFSNASCRRIGDAKYMAEMDISFLWRLLDLCVQLSPIIKIYPRKLDHADLKRDYSNNALNLKLIDELIYDMRTMPQSAKFSLMQSLMLSDVSPNQKDLSIFIVFVDLVKLIWVHEWAHILCGHVDFTHLEMGLAQLGESQQIDDVPMIEGSRMPSFAVLQSFELQADQFATDQCVVDILFGADPAAWRISGDVELVHRMIMFNAACSIFAVIWAQREEEALCSKAISFCSGVDSDLKLFEEVEIIQSSHPPAELRYERMRSFQREMMINQSTGDLHDFAGLSIDSQSLNMAHHLSAAHPLFERLQHLTPLMFRLLSVDTIEIYEQKLHEARYEHDDKIRQSCYIPRHLLQDFLWDYQKAD